MHPLDLVIVVLFMAFLLALGFFLSKKAGKDTDHFILAGRKMPWWLAGTSMVATGLNASTMLQDSRKIRQDGIAGLWFTWQNIINGAVATVWFFRLWRRAGYVTQMEFYRDRYTGWRADFARLFDTVFYGIFVGAAWAAVGLVGMKKIVSVILDVPPSFVILGWSVPTDTVVVLTLVLIALVYSAASGVYGVVWTDFVEFFVAMICSVGLMLVVYAQVGWNTGLAEKIHELPDHGRELLKLLPAFGPVLIYFFFIHPIFTQGGYNPHIQRFLALKNEREVVYMIIYNQVINFVFKPFPFYVCGLAGIFIFSDSYVLNELGSITTPAGEVIPDFERVYPALVRDFLPIGLTGLMIAGFMSAFMSSFDTNIHNATSVFTNDIYRGYIAKNRSEKHYVRVSRLYMIFQTLLASIIGIVVQDILSLTMIALALPISAGVVKLLRFVWWRVNGWSEVVAQITSLVTIAIAISPLGRTMMVTIMGWFGVSGNDGFFVTRQFFLISISSVISIAAIFLTRPEPMDRLVAFYKRVRPYGWWDPVIAEAGESYRNTESRPMLLLLTCTILGITFGFIFTALAFVLAMWYLLVPAFLIGLVSLWFAFFAIRKLYPDGGEM